MKTNKLTKTVFIVNITIFFIISTTLNSFSQESKKDYNEEKIESEILAKYAAFDGPIKNQTVELWDTYFLNSPNIGNVHNNGSEIGWQTVHDGSVEYFSKQQEGIMKFYDINIYIINAKLAWVDGKFKITQPDGAEVRVGFYDSLIKTNDGWRVIVSVVNPIKSN